MFKCFLPRLLPRLGVCFLCSLAMAAHAQAPSGALTLGAA